MKNSTHTYHIAEIIFNIAQFLFWLERAFNILLVYVAMSYLNFKHILLFQFEFTEATST